MVGQGQNCLLDVSVSNRRFLYKKYPVFPTRYFQSWTLPRFSSKIFSDIRGAGKETKVAIHLFYFISCIFLLYFFQTGDYLIQKPIVDFRNTILSFANRSPSECGSMTFLAVSAFVFQWSLDKTTRNIPTSHTGKVKHNNLTHREKSSILQQVEIQRNN